MKVIALSKQSLIGLLFFIVIIIGNLLFFLFKDTFKVIPTSMMFTKPALAIVIDDVSNGDNSGINDLLDNKINVTYAIMPFFPESKQKAQELSNRGYQVIVHMPMESYDGLEKWLGPKPLKIGFNENEIINELREAFKEVPYAQGMNNHMGSKVTDDDKTMSVVMYFLKQKQYFFLDSKTGMKKNVSTIARVYHVNYLQRDIFLDEINSKQHIKKQLALAIKTAKRQGYAIAIGHVGFTGKNTSQSIKEMLPEFRRQGVELVNLDKVLRLASY